MQLRPVQRQEGCDDGEARHAVDRERPARADGGDQDSADGGPDQAAELEDRRVQADRVAQVVRADEFVDEDLPGRVVDHSDETQGERDHVDVPHLNRTGQGECGEDCRKDRGRRLAEDEQALFRVAVGDDTAPEPEQEHGRELHGDGDADGGNTARQLKHEPVHRDALHPHSRVGDEVRCRELAIVRHPEGDERLTPRRAFAQDGHGAGRRRCCGVRGSHGRSCELSVGCGFVWLSRRLFDATPRPRILRLN